MKRFLIFTIMVLVAATIKAQTDTLSLRDITSNKFSPKYVGGIRPMAGASTYSRISEDKKRIETFYYKNGKLCKVLFDKHKAKGDSVPEFDDYTISPDGTKILLRTDCKNVYRRSTKAKYYVYDSKTNMVNMLDKSNEVQNPVWSNDGTKVAYIIANNIYIKGLLSNTIKQVTTDGKKNEIINGIPDWVYEEEFSTSNSMCFTSDDKALCWLRYDESKVPVYYLQVFDDGKNIHSPYTETKDGFYSYKYPQAGETNSSVTAWAYNLAEGTTTALRLPVGKEDYIPRLLPIPQSKEALLVTLNRHQDSLCVYHADPLTGDCNLIIKKQGDRYFKELVITDMKIENNHLLIPNDIGDNISVDVYDMNGKLVRNVSLKGHDIVSVYGIDKKGRVYYQAAYPTPIDRSVFCDDINLTNKKGCSSANFSGDYNYFVKVWSDAQTPHVYSIADNKGRDIKILEDNHALRDTLVKYNLPSPEFFTFKTADGIELNGWRIRPSVNTENNDSRLPVIMHQYSGPGSQEVVNTWSIGSMRGGAMYDKYLAQQGFIVVCVDGRGTGSRGPAFEKCTYLNIGQIECHDQIETAKWLAQQPDIDPQRIAIWGWSYGGFNTLMCLTDSTSIFKCGVAIAPPTSWRYYDTVYTERFMRTPQENATGYDVCPLSRAKNLRGELFIIHGLADDNVHPQNTLEFSEALVQAGKNFRQQLYTNRNHGIRGGNTRYHLLRQVTNWFETTLK